MTVRLVNLASHQSYDRTGDAYFIVPAGRYSIQLLRAGSTVYQEAEYISASAPSSRTVNPKKLELAVGIPTPSPQFDSNVCSALESAIRLTIASFGLSDADIQRRLANADLRGSLHCTTSADLDSVLSTLTGSYGINSLGMVDVSIDYSPLAPLHRPHNRGNSPIYLDPSTQRLATAQQPASNLTPDLVNDIKNGIADLGVDESGKPLLVCGAIDVNTPVFCDTNGLVTATPAIAHLRALYHLRVQTKPVDFRGVEDDRWTTFAGEEEYRVTQEKLAADVKAIQENLLKRIAQVQASLVSAQSAQADGQTVQSYVTSDLLTLLDATQSEFNQALREATLHPLRQHFPQVLATLPESADPSTPAPVAEKAFRDLKDAITTLGAASGNLGIDLVFRTTPVEAEGVHLSFDHCERCMPVVSQGGERRFYRGRYYVRANLDGYVPYEGWLDLVDDPRTILECEMVRVHRASDARGSTCSLRSQ
ncbi:hypothetical protein ACPOL_1263 [Acidisarcina polymorpha]|uniref:Uncharacterized protein n=2 Tax=Acidisarcina polymorpha TaxID=2211140 RepID=A0A2Z5FUS1_9BACT|nr:hypothetical protein ACPOL_1263 [Acidisarcina polymorpha]